MRITMQSRFAANNTLLMRSNGCFLVNMDRKKRFDLVWFDSCVLPLQRLHIIMLKMNDKTIIELGYHKIS